MIKNTYDRYEIYRNADGSIDQLPFIPISTSNNDKYEEWIIGRSRMDKLSQKFYNDPFYDFFILFANPEYISEFDIPEGVLVRIPFPLDRVKKEYEDGLEKIRKQ
ncbi:MAG: hypothetical protein HC836_28120 [Richelia sp. RM2_1_2]|nr:hypothetical protein [Richelia sp. RM2_1_2]